MVNNFITEKNYKIDPDPEFHMVEENSQDYHILDDFRWKNVHFRIYTPYSSNPLRTKYKDHNLSNKYKIMVDKKVSSWTQINI